MEKTDVIETLDITNSVTSQKSNSEKDSALLCFVRTAIRDLSESGSEHGKPNEEYFNISVKTDVDENYEADSKPSIINILSKCRSQRILKICVNLLKKNGILEQYEALLNEWIEEGVVKKYRNDENEHYLPHKAV